MRLRSLRKLEEMEIRTEDKNLRHELKGIKTLLAREPSNGPRSASRSASSRHVRRRRRSASAAPNSLTRPSTISPRSRGVRRTRAGHCRRFGQGLGGVREGPRRRSFGLTFKTDDQLGSAFFAETTVETAAVRHQRKILFARRFKLPGGRGHGEPIRMFMT